MGVKDGAAASLATRQCGDLDWPFRPGSPANGLAIMRPDAFRLLAGTLALLVAAGSYAASGPIFFNSEPNAEAYGAARAYPIPEIGKPFTQQTIVGWHSHYDQVATMRTVAKGSSVSQFEFIDENGGGVACAYESPASSNRRRSDREDARAASHTNCTSG